MNECKLKLNINFQGKEKVILDIVIISHPQRRHNLSTLQKKIEKNQNHARNNSRLESKL